MARSFSLSFFIHLCLLCLLLLGSILLEPADSIDKGEEVTVRPMELNRPSRPDLRAGEISLDETETLSQPTEQPSPEPLDLPTEPLASTPETVSTEPPSQPPSSEPTTRNDGGSQKPRFLISSPDYPTYQPDGKGQERPGDDPYHLKGESTSKDRPAIPYYHPTVTLHGADGREWILVRFEVEANGTSKVEMLEGTGNIHQDARVLNVLRRWKWLPMKIDGQTYRSIEIVRLYRKDLGKS